MTKEFEKLYRKDQKIISDLKKKKIGKKEYFLKTKSLGGELKKLLEKKKNLTGKDYFISAIIFHHNYKLNSSKKAVRLSKKSYEIGYKKGKWLIASTTDRLLQLERKPQKYGTQVVDIFSDKLNIYKTDPKTTDEERKEFGLPTFKELKKYYEK